MTDDSTHGERVKASILATGLELWRDNAASVSARKIGQRLGMTHGAVLYHFTNADGMKHALAVEAVRTGDAVIVPMLIAAKHPAVCDMPGVERARYLAGC
jgi:AcrR family transcriptional regulator